MLRLSVTLAVLVATFATSNELIAQRRTPLRNFARQIGIQWGTGYHFRNPGPIVDYYSPWSETNQSIIQNPGNNQIINNNNNNIGGYFDAGIDTPIHQNQIHTNPIRPIQPIQTNPNQIPQNTGNTQPAWNTQNQPIHNGQFNIQPQPNRNIPGNIHSTGIQQNQSWPNQTGIGTRQGTIPTTPGTIPPTRSTIWDPADNSYQINEQINRNLKPWHQSGHESIGITPTIQDGNSINTRTQGTPYDRQFETSKPFKPRSSN